MDRPGLGRLVRNGLVERHGPFLTLPGRGELVAIRARRHNASVRLWPDALRSARLVARLPFVRMVAVTGPRAPAGAGDDVVIGLVIVATDGRTGTVGAGAAALARLARRRGVRLMPGPILARSALAVADTSPASARELAQLAPVAGFDVHRELLARNAWVAEQLPNAAPATLAGPSTPSGMGRTLLEIVLLVPVFDAAERWATRRGGPGSAAGQR